MTDTFTIHSISADLIAKKGAVHLTKRGPKGPTSVHITGLDLSALGDMKMSVADDEVLKLAKQEMDAAANQSYVLPDNS